MDPQSCKVVIRRMQAIPLINFFGNVLAATVTFVWFSFIIAGLLGPGSAEMTWLRLQFFTAILACLFAVIIPINVRWFLPITSGLRRISKSADPKCMGSDRSEELRGLAAKIIDLPVKLALTTCLGWVLCGIVIGALPHLFPKITPWNQSMTHKMSAWMIFVGAPVTVVFIYFVQEWWLRNTVRKWFPRNLLLATPRSYSIRMLPKLLFVTVMLGTLPVSLVSHITLNQIALINEGRQYTATFLEYMPHAIQFLLGVSVAVAIGISFFMGKSLSENFKAARDAMQEIRKGDLSASIPVVSNDEMGRVGAAFNRMVAGLRERDLIRDTFGRYLSEEVAEEILKSPERIDMGGELRDITILVSDLRGFTSMTEALEPRQVLRILNRYFEKMTEVIHLHEGTIDEFTGDGILVFFGAPRKTPDHTRRAVACALEMQDRMEELNQENLSLGLPRLSMGIGINCGELVVGNIGSEKRTKYGAVGSPINVAFRVESQTKSHEILVSAAVKNRIGEDLQIQQTRQADLKGFDESVALYLIAALYNQ